MLCNAFCSYFVLVFSLNLCQKDILHYKVGVSTKNVDILVCGASNYVWVPDISEVSQNLVEVVVSPLGC
jgi:hypothetical protein